MPYTGRCACDAVRITISAEPLTVRQCWCRHCQQLAAGHATTNAIFPTDAIEFSGNVKWNEHQAESGNTLRWGFCPECGTQLFAFSSARPHMRVVRVGAIDRPHGIKPQVAIWTDEAPEWASFSSDIERHPRQPPAPPPKA